MMDAYKPVNTTTEDILAVLGSQPSLLWNRRVEGTNLEELKRRVEEKHGCRLDSYRDFHKWSIENSADFWEEIWMYLKIVVSKPYEQVFLKTGDGFLDYKWFVGAKFNYAENLLRIRDNRVALTCADEFGYEESLTFAQLFDNVQLFAAAFRKNGLEVGDRVACYMSNIKEAYFAMLAATSIGAIWCGPSPFYGKQAASIILKSMEPKILIAVDQFQSAGKKYYLIENLSAIAECTPSLTHVIIVPTNRNTVTRDISNIRNSVLLDNFLDSGRLPDGSVPDLKFEQLPFEHPVTINLTSGTSGMPKGLVHSAGILLPVLRDYVVNFNFKEGDSIFSNFVNGWNEFELQMAPLAAGVRVVLYNGDPYVTKEGRPNLWDILSKYKVTFVFLVASEVDKMEKEGVRPDPASCLDHLRVVAIGTSPVKRQNFEYILNNIKKDVFVCSKYCNTEGYGDISGADFNSPLYSGEIQAPSLGVDIRCLDENGKHVVGKRGELVITNPSPIFPVYLWKDENNEILKKTYLNKFEGMWNLHDSGWINPLTNGIVVTGRSDDTVKIKGIRFMPEDIYLAIHDMEDLSDYVCVVQDGSYGFNLLVLFVKLKNGNHLTHSLRKKIEMKISNALWNLYVPEVILDVPEIPYNLNNKKAANLVKRIITSNQVPEVMNIRNPQCLRHFCDRSEIINYVKKTQKAQC